MKQLLSADLSHIYIYLLQSRYYNNNNVQFFFKNYWKHIFLLCKYFAAISVYIYIYICNHGNKMRHPGFHRNGFVTTHVLFVRLYKKMYGCTATHCWYQWTKNCIYCAYIMMAYTLRLSSCILHIRNIKIQKRKNLLCLSSRVPADHYFPDLLLGNSVLVF